MPLRSFVFIEDDSEMHIKDGYIKSMPSVFFPVDSWALFINLGRKSSIWVKFASRVLISLCLRITIQYSVFFRPLDFVPVVCLYCAVCAVKYMPSEIQ